MDPITVGLVAVLAFVVVIVSLVAFRSFAKETDFEEAYGASALRLLSEEKSSKPKGSKANRNKVKNTEKKKDTSFEKEHKSEKKVEEASADIPQPVLSAVSQKLPDDVMPLEPKQSKKKNKNKHKDENTTDDNKNISSTIIERNKEDEVPVIEEMKQTLVEEVVQTSPVKESLKEEHHVGEGAERKKKKRSRRVDEPPPEEVQREDIQDVRTEARVTEEEPVLPQKIKEEKKQEKPKPKKSIISVKEINPDKLHTRLSAIEELEPEYLSFLAMYFSDTGAQRTKLLDENAHLKKQINDKERLFAQCSEKLSMLPKKESEILQLQHSLAEEQKKYSSFEQNIRLQITQDKKYIQRLQEQHKAEVANLQEELKKAKAIANAVPPPVDTSAFQKQADILQSELNANKSRAMHLENELKMSLQKVQQLKNEIQSRDRQIELVSQSNAANEKRAADIESSAKLEKQKLEATLQKMVKAMEELQESTAKLQKEKFQKAANMENERVNEITNQLHVLEKNLHNVEKERDSLKAEALQFQAQLAAESETHKKNLQNVENERNFLKEESSQLKAQLATEIESLKRSLKSVEEERESLKAEALLFQAKLSAEDENHKKALEKLRNETAELHRLSEENKAEVAAKLVKEANEAAAARQKLNEVMKENESNLGVIRKLKDELEKFKNDEEQILSSLRADLEKAKAALKVAEATKHVEVKRLQDQINELKLAAPVIASVHGVENEVMELSKTRSLGSAGPSDGQMESLRKELAEQQKRNNDLREANYKVVEISQRQEQLLKKHIQEAEAKYEQALRKYRNETAKALSDALPRGSKIPSVFGPGSCNAEDFDEWLKQACSVMKKITSSEPSTSVSSKENTPPQKLGRAYDDKISELEAAVEKYRAVLAAVSSNIEQIELEAAQREEVYKQKITQLMEQIKQERNAAKRSHRLKRGNDSLNEMPNGRESGSYSSSDRRGASMSSSID